MTTARSKTASSLFVALALLTATLAFTTANAPTASAQNAPSSANYTINGSGSKILVNFNNIPFTDTDNHTLNAIQITQLPASGGTLKTLRTWRNRYSPVNVTLNQVVTHPDLSGSFNRKQLYFYPSAGSGGGTFKFKVRDSSNTLSGSEYTATITVPTAPAKPTGLTVLNSTGNAVSGVLRLSWTNPNNQSISKWEFATNNTALHDDGNQGDNNAATDFTSYTTICQSTDPNAAEYDANCKNVTAHSMPLTQSGSYQFKIRAGNGVGSTESDATTTIAYTVANPVAPTGLSATNGVADTKVVGVTLTWTDPLDPSIVGYQYRTNDPRADDDNDTSTPVATDFGSWAWICQSFSLSLTTSYDANCGDWTSGEVSPLTQASTRQIELRGFNTIATPGFGTASSVTIVPGTPPAKPAVSASSNSTSQVALSWGDPDNSAIDRYQYRQNNIAVNDDNDATTPVATDFGSWTTICQSTDSNQSATYDASCDDKTSHNFTVTSTGTGTNLQAGQSYQFQVRVDEKDFTGALATVSNTVSIKAGVPAKPTGFTATGGAGQVALSWTDPSDSGIDSYQYRINDTTADDDNDSTTSHTLDFGSWQSISGSNATTTSHTVTPLRKSGKYEFEVRAADSTAGAGPGSSYRSATVTPAPQPAKPTNFAAASTSDGSVGLSWDNPSNPHITLYRFRYKVASDESQGNKESCGGATYSPWKLVGSRGANTTGYRVYGLCDWVKFTFQVRAETSGGAGPASDEASATTLKAPAKPSGISATAESTATTLSWTDPSNPNITGYKYRYKTTGTNTWNPDWTTITTSSASTTSHRLTGLTNGTSYTFEVRAYHSTAGDGGASNQVVVVVGPPPAKPTGVAGAPDGSRRVRLSWTNPNNSAITKWQYRQNDTTVDDDNDSNTNAASDYTSWQVICQSTDSSTPNTYNTNCATATSHGIYGLTNGRLYKFQIRAVSTPITVKHGGQTGDISHDSIGTASDEASATPATTPARVRDLSATAGDAEVALSWTNPSDSSITRFEYRYRYYNTSTKDYTSYTSWATIPSSGASTTSYTKTGLTNGVLHEFEVRAVNSHGNGTAAHSATATTLAKPAKPAVTATAGNGQVTLSWPVANDSSITRWEYRQNDTTANDDNNTSTGVATDFGNWTPISSSGATTTAHTVTGLADSRAYKFQVRAVNASGNGTASDEDSATTNPPAPSAPTGLSASAGQWQAVLTWSNPNNSNITGYQFRKNDTAANDDNNTNTPVATDHGPWTSIPSSNATTTTYTATSLTAGTWKFQLRARTLGGNSSASSEASVTLHAPPTAPSGFAASPGDKQVVLTWSDPTNANISSWQYRQNDTTADDDNNTSTGVATDFGAWQTISSSNATTTTVTISSLTNYRRYGFEVRALTAVWTGTTDTTGGAITDAQYAAPSLVPTTPANLTAAPFPVTEQNEDNANNGTAVVLTWDASSGSRNSNITARQYRYKSAGSYGNWTNLCTTLADSTCPTLTTYTVTGLTVNTDYTFQVQAQNPAGTSGTSSEASATTAALPKAPTGLTATASNEQVTLSWTIPDADTNQTGHQHDASVTSWEYAQSTSATTGTWTVICQNTDPSGADYDANCASATSHTITGLTNNTDYWFQIRTVNPAGSRVAVTTTDGKTRPALVKARPVPNPPAKPTNLSATAGQRSAALTWTDPSNSDITGYEYRQNKTTAHDDGDTSDGDAATDYSGWKTICQSTNSSATNTYNASCDNATSHTVTSLSSGPWKFQIRARTPGGYSSVSSEASVTLHDPPAAATGFTAAPGDQQVVLTWSDPSNSNISSWQYRMNDTTVDDNSDGDDDGDGDGIDDDSDGKVDNDVLAAHDFGAWQTISSSNATTTTVTVSSLTNYRSYGFEVRALTAVWTGSTDTTGGVIAAPKYATPSLVPTTPANLTAATYPVTEQNETDSKNGTAVVLSWDASSGSNNTNISARQYRYKSAGSYGNWTNLCTTLADSTCPSFTTYTVTGLTVNTDYTFQVRAQNPAGTSSASSEASATTAALAKAPTGLTAVGKDTEVDLSWTIPDADTNQTGHQHDASVTSWEYAQSSGGTTGDWTVICQNTDSSKTDTYNTNCASATSHTVTGLTNNTVYSYQLRSVNPAGTRLAVVIVGDRSSPASVSVRPVAAPGKPTLQSPSSIARNASAELRWTTPTNASTTVFEWQYQQNDTTNDDDGDGDADKATDYGSWTTICQNTNSDGTGYSADCAAATSFTVTGLTNNRLYKFKIRAQNTADADGTASDEISVTPLPPPAALSGLSAEGRDKSAVLTWSTPAADTAKATITGWQYRYKVGAGTYIPWADVTSSTRTTTTHTVTGLNNNRSHTFQLRATSNSGPSAASNDATTTTLPPPSAPTVSSVGRNQSVDLSWDKLDNSAITKFQYQYKTDGSYTNWLDIPNSGATTTAHTVQYTTSGNSVTTTRLSNGTAYTFKVRAVITPGPGAGAASSETAATPIALPAAPTGLAAAGSYNDATKKSQVVLTWTKPTETALLNRIAKYQYKYFLFKSADPTLFDWTDIPSSDKNTTTYTITGLANDDSTIRAQIRVVATNKDTSAGSSIASTSTALPAPTSFSAVGRVQSVDLSWADPNHGGITKYQYRYQSAQGSCTGTPPNLVCTPATYTAWVDIPSSGPNTTSHTVSYTTSGGSVTTTPLSNNTTYPFQIRAYITSTGGGAPSLWDTAVPKAVPGKPSLTVTPSTATGSGNTAQAALIWTGATGIVAGTTWQYRYKTATSNTWNPDWAAVPDSNYNTTGYTITGLPNNRHYLFQVRATNSGGTGSASDAVGATTGPKPSQSVTLGTLTGGDHQVVLNWTTASGTPGIAGFQYRYNNTSASDDNDGNDNDAATDYTAWADIPNSDKDTTTYTVTGLDNGANHFFEVRASNTTGTGPASTAKSAHTIPAAPAMTSVTDGGTQMTLTWADPDNSSITRYQYQYEHTGTYNNWANIPNSGAATTTFTASNLNANNNYTFKLRAVNASGDGDPSASAPSTTPPGAPTGLTAAGSYNTTTSKSQIALTWTNPNNTAITKYQYRHKTTGDYTDWTDVPNSGAATTAHTITGLTSDDALHTAQIRAVITSNSIDINSAPAQATARAAMPAPTSFSAIGRVQSADLSWADPNNSRITKYQYRYQKISDTYTDWTDIPSSGATTTSHTVSSLNNGTTYPFQIRAYSTEAGAGAPSLLNTAVPKAIPGKPRLLITPSTTAGTGTIGQGALRWTGATGIVAGTTWEYRYKTTGDYADWAPVPDSTWNTSGYTVTGLTNNIVHSFQARATNSGGTGSASDAVTVTIGPKPSQKPALGTPVGGDRRVTLNWTTPNANPVITKFQYRQKDNSKPTPSFGDWTDIPGSDAATTSLTVTGLKNGVNYAFQVRAANHNGGGPASAEKSTDTFPAAPTGFEAVGRARSIDLSWDDPENSSITAWQFRRKTTGSFNSWTTIPNSGATTTAYTITGLTNHKDYTVELRSKNSSGNSAAATATARPLKVPDAPANLAVTVAPAMNNSAIVPGKFDVTLSWDNPNSGLTLGHANYEEISGYQYQMTTASDTANWTPKATAWADIANTGVTTTSVTLTDVASGRTAVALRAVAPEDDGPSSQTAMVLAGTTTLSIARVANTLTGTLSWTEPSDSHLIGFWEYRRRTAADHSSDYRAWSQWLTIPGSDETTTSYPVTAEAARHQYQVRAQGLNTGNASGSATISFVPAKPANLTAKATYDDPTTPINERLQASLSWDDASDSTINRYEYRYKIKDANDSTYTDWKPICQSTNSKSSNYNANCASVTAATVTGLNPGKSYTIRLRAANAVSLSTAATVDVNPAAQSNVNLVPATPSGVTYSKTLTTMSLSWPNPNNATIDGYQYCDRYLAQVTDPPGSCAWVTIVNSGYNTTSHTLTGLVAGTHIVQIRAVNGSGHSNPSGQINALYIPPTTTFARPATDGAFSPLRRFTIGFSHDIASSAQGAPFTDDTIDGIVTLKRNGATGSAVAFDAVYAANASLSWDDANDADIERWEYRFKDKALADSTYTPWAVICQDTQSTDPAYRSDCASLTSAVVDVSGLNATKSHTVQVRATKTSGQQTTAVVTHLFNPGRDSLTGAITVTLDNSVSSGLVYAAISDQWYYGFATPLVTGPARNATFQMFVFPTTPPTAGLSLPAGLPVPDATNTEFYSGIITGPGFCANHSLGGPTTYPYDSNGDGIADVCSLPYTRREAVARQLAHGVHANHNPDNYLDFVEQACQTIADQTFEDSADDLAQDVCATGTLAPTPELPPKKSATLFYSGVIDGPGFCANHSLGGPTTYPYDSDDNGIADVCSLPYTRREAVARQLAYLALAHQLPGSFEALIAWACGTITGQTYNDHPDDLAKDICATE